MSTTNGTEALAPAILLGCVVLMLLFLLKPQVLLLQIFALSLYFEAGVHYLRGEFKFLHAKFLLFICSCLEFFCLCVVLFDKLFCRCEEFFRRYLHTFSCVSKQPNDPSSGTRDQPA